MRPADRAAYFVSWSGGKDACLAMHRLAREHGTPACLLSMLDEHGERSRGHYLRPEVLAAQAEAIGTRLELRSASWDSYEATFTGALHALKADGIAEGAFGDIDLDEHREWVERVCGSAGIDAREPLWQEERRELLREFIGAGYVALVAGVKDGVLSPSVLGRPLTEELIGEFEAAGIDACGELGEYHTVVVDGPLFRHRVRLEAGAQVSYDGYRFVDLIPE